MKIISKGILAVTLLVTFSFFTINYDIVSAQESMHNITKNNITNDVVNLLSSITQMNNPSNNSTNNLMDDSQTKASSLNLQNSTYVGPVFLNLGDISLPPNAYLFLYDSAPLNLVEAHLLTNLPCDENGIPRVSIVAGTITQLHQIFLSPISELSMPGDSCLYQHMIGKDSSSPIRQVAIYNNSTEEVEFGSINSLIVGTSKLSTFNNFTEYQPVE